MKKLLLLSTLAVMCCGCGTTTVKIGNLEVMTEDLGKMNWSEAKEACAALGDGWRLPTKDKLNKLYETRQTIGGFAGNYWSSTEYDTGTAH